MKKLLVLLCMTVALHGTLHAQIPQNPQTPLIKGRVIDDSTGAPISKVSVLLSGTGKGAATDLDGTFTLAWPSDGKRHHLIISSTGYEVVNLPVNTPADKIIVRLKNLSKDLGDVVVIGYQSVRRKDVLASVSSVTSRDLKDIPLNSAEESLAGRLAGVQVVGSEGSPNAQVLIRVRGGGSITQDNSPLYVVDGIQVDNALSTLSIQDIESISVLKDAASTSIYGARGANGVVLITTKGGRNTAGKIVRRPHRSGCPCA